MANLLPMASILLSIHARALGHAYHMYMKRYNEQANRN